jgi:hypothetical protein
MPPKRAAAKAAEEKKSVQKKNPKQEEKEEVSAEEEDDGSESDEEPKAKKGAKKARKEVPSSTEPRTIHVQGGKGNSRCEKIEGKFDFVLPPGAGLADLKKMIRQKLVFWFLVVFPPTKHPNDPYIYVCS